MLNTDRRELALIKIKTKHFIDKVMDKRSCFQILAGVIDNIAKQVTIGTN